MEPPSGKITTLKIKKQITQEKEITFEDIAQPEIPVRAKMSLNQKKMEKKKTKRQNAWDEKQIDAAGHQGP